MNKALSLTAFLFIGQFLFPQGLHDKCGTDQFDSYLKNQLPEYASFRVKQEQPVRNDNYFSKSAGTILIPVVVHVIYRKSEQNISDAQIQSQIDVLNKDYNKLNWDTVKVPSVWKNLIADCEIEFILANRDPNGKFTNGITRKETTIINIASIGGNVYYQSSKGGQDIWDRDRYLNIWVCEILGGVYGFSSLPGSPAASDGLVIVSESFGSAGSVTSPTDKGRTTTHEIGHWFDIFHLWGLSDCGDDFVADTPIQLKENFGCKTYPHNTTCNTTPDGEMFMNFMDYSDDNCLNMFTIDQKSRMLNTINTVRASLLTSNGYNSITTIDKIDIKVFPSPASDYLKIKFDTDLELFNIELLDINGRVISAIDIAQSRSNQSINVTQIKNGMYFIKLYTSKGILTEKVLVWHD